MRVIRVAAFLALAAIAGLVLPVLAIARTPKARTGTIKSEVLESFSVKGTHGYTLTVKLRDRHELEVAAGKFVGGPSISAVGAAYTVPYHQARGSDSIAAAFGGLGRIDVDFVPKSQKKVAPERTGCGGGKTSVEEGRFVGTISFVGDGGYTHVHAKGAKGAIVKTPPLTCSIASLPKSEKALERELEGVRARSEPEPDSEMESVGLRVTADGGRVRFKGNLLRSKENKESFSLISFSAAAIRHRGPVKEESIAVTGLGPGKSFLVPDFLHPTTEANIRPGSPFTGSAVFRHQGSDPASWSGDLAVDLPGFGHVRLTGKGTHAAMCETVLCKNL
jgi:hypothetical protein